MSTVSPASKDCHKEYVRLLRQLHQLLVEGEGESCEADDVRDQMDLPWESLSAEQREQVGGLIADLNGVRRGPVPSPKSKEELLREELPALEKASELRDWHGVLKSLRRLAPYLSIGQLSYLQGRAWSELGDDETALIFFEHAVRHDQENGNSAWAVLDCLNRVDPTRAQERARKILFDDTRYSFAEVIKAASLQWETVRDLPDDLARPILAQLVQIFERTLLRMKLFGDDHQKPSIFAMACCLGGFCHEQLGDSNSARRLLNQGLAVSPNSESILVARGILLYGREPHTAIDDFKKVVERGSSLVWPYFYLAHYHLMKDKFDRCLELSGHALALAKSATVRANLLEWMAICQSELGFPTEVVLALFQAARAQAPQNERIVRNAETFVASIQQNLAVEPSWEKEAEETIRAIGVTEYRPKLAA